VSLGIQRIFKGVLAECDALIRCNVDSGSKVNPVMDLAKKSKKESVPEPEPPQAASKWRVLVGNLASGAIAGCAVEAALYPLDTIKTRLQMMRSGGGLSALLKAGGGKALYAGIGCVPCYAACDHGATSSLLERCIMLQPCGRWNPFPCRGNLLGMAPATAVFMAVYEPAKKHFAAETGSQQQGFLISAALAGWAASLVRVPTEVVKQRLQAGEFKRPTEAVRSHDGCPHATARASAC
jgi:solute carrier family 25 (mitochondrial S-adenosylmethionine transporter), member 26